MRKFHPLFILAISLLYSCSNDQDDALEPLQPDPTVISQYHILSATGEISEKYTFDRLGNITIYRKMTNDFENHYVFDDQFKLTQIVKKDLDGNLVEVLQDIAYDNNDKVVNINNRAFSFNEQEQYYIDHSTYSLIENTQQDGYFASELFYNRFDLEANSTMPKVCYYVYEQSGYPGDITVWETCDYYSEAYRINYNSSNVKSFGTTSPTFYTYDATFSPLYFNGANTSHIVGLLVGLNGIEHEELYPLISANNLINSINGYSADPIEDRGERIFSYEFNNNSLPETAFFRLGLSEPNSTTAYAKYYYQGDEIPQ